MSILEILLAVIFITLTLFLSLLSITTLQLIKELKNSLSKINRLLDKPENITPLPVNPLKKLEETLTFSQPTKPNSPPRLFHRQQPK